MKRQKMQTGTETKEPKLTRREETRRKKNEISKNITEKSRLQEWLVSYGISRETREIRGAEEHISRLRGNTLEGSIAAEGFKFTFKKVTQEVRKQAEKIETYVNVLSFGTFIFLHFCPLLY